MSNVFDNWDEAFSGIGSGGSVSAGESVSISALRSELESKRKVLESLSNTQRSAEFSSLSESDKAGVLTRLNIARSEVDELQTRLGRAERRAREVTDLIVKEVRSRIASDKRLNDQQRRVVAEESARMLKSTVSGGGLDNPHLYADPVKISEAASYMLQHGYGGLHMNSDGGGSISSPGLGTVGDDFVDESDGVVDPFEAGVQKHYERFAAGDPSLNSAKSYADVLREKAAVELKGRKA